MDFYLSYAKELIDRGVDSIVIKDMAGLLTPRVSYELVKELKRGLIYLLIFIHMLLQV